MRPFLPTPRQTNWLILLGFTALAGAVYVRQSILEADLLEAACATGAPLAACSVRRFVLELSELGAFGGFALIASILHFVRPRVRTFSAALCAATLGLIWGNPVSSAFAAALLTVAFARPHAGSRTPASPAPPPPTTPASSRTIH